MNNDYNKKFQIWSISHLPLEELEKKYNFKETENLKLYYTRGNNDGINIDKYNYEFSEYTGIYYVWKNKLKSDIVGFCGYRRFFNPSMIDLDRINKGEVQTWECPRGFYHPLTGRCNNFIEWCLCFNYHDFVIYKFCETLSKFTNKSVNIILRELTDTNIISTYPGRHMFICKWEIFEKIMTIYDDFLNRLIPDFDKDDNFEKYFEIQKILLTQKYNIGNLKIHKDQNFCWDFNNKLTSFNRRLFSYYNETFLGAVIQYFFPTFEKTLNYYVDIENIDDSNKQNILDLYLKNSLYKGVRGMYCYNLNMEQVNLNNLFPGIENNSEYYKLIGINKYWAIDYKNGKREIKEENYYEKNIFLKFNKEKNVFILDEEIK